jgi:hypothetical protein
MSFFPEEQKFIDDNHFPEKQQNHRTGKSRAACQQKIRIF